MVALFSVVRSPEIVTGLLAHKAGYGFPPPTSCTWNESSRHFGGEGGIFYRFLRRWAESGANTISKAPLKERGERGVRA